MSSVLQLHGAAVLIWLPKGVDPREPGFDVSSVTKPPSENPEPWWRLAQAIRYAVTVERDHDKLPWIKIDAYIMDPAEISETYENMGNVS